MHAQSRCMSQYLRQSKSITCSGMCSETDGLGDQPSQQYRQGPITERGSCRHAHHISLLLPVCPTFLVSRQTSLCTASKSRSSPSTTRRARCMSLLTHPFHLHTTSSLFKRCLFGCPFEPWVLRLPAAIGRPIRHRGTERRGTGGGTRTLYHLSEAPDPLEVGLSTPDTVEGRCGEGAGWG